MIQPESTVQVFGVLSAVLAVIAAVPYVYTTFTGETKPERAAFLIWGVTTGVAFFANWADGAEDSLWLSGADFAIALFMVVVVMKYGYGWVKGRDTKGVAVAALGVVLWLVTDQPVIALLASISVDAVGSVLVAVKAYEAPETEYFPSYVIYFAGAVCAVLSVGRVDYTLLSYPIYAVVSTAIIMVAIHMGRKKKEFENETASTPKAQ